MTHIIILDNYQIGIPKHVLIIDKSLEFIILYAIRTIFSLIINLILLLPYFLVKNPERNPNEVILRVYSAIIETIHPNSLMDNYVNVFIILINITI